MTTTTLPAQLLVEPRIENWIDDSDPHYDFVAGYVARCKDDAGWHEVCYYTSSGMVAWLQEHGYEQVSCTMRRHQLAGRYEHG